MKRLLRSWVFWVFVVVPVAWVVVRYTYRRAQAHVCSTCYSQRVTSRWKIGVDGKWSWPLGPHSETLVESHVQQDGWMGGHDHGRGWVVTGNLASMFDDSQGGLLARYESDPAFRAFMLSKRERGEVTREEFRAALGPPFLFSIMSEIDTASRLARFAPWWDEFERAPR